MAERLTKFDSFTLEEWESGRDVPSLAELRKLEEAYKRPLAVFFLTEPPLKFDAQREFRRLAGIKPGKESPKLLQELGWAVVRREIAKDGPGYTRLVLDAFDRRQISTSAASDYLGVNPRHFPIIRHELTHRPALLGA